MPFVVEAPAPTAPEKPLVEVTAEELKAETGGYSKALEAFFVFVEVI